MFAPGGFRSGEPRFARVALLDRSSVAVSNCRKLVSKGSDWAWEKPASYPSPSTARRVRLGEPFQPAPPSLISVPRPPSTASYPPRSRPAFQSGSSSYYPLGRGHDHGGGTAR